MKLPPISRIIDVIQWLMIVVLVSMLVIQGVNYKKTKKDLITSTEYNRDNTYFRIYESKKLNKLKKENKELYDSISKLQDVESGMIIKFKERYKTDTISVDKFVVIHDTINKMDSIYHYANNNDTVNLYIDVKAQDLKWVKADFTIHDQFMIVNREKNGVNQTLIHHSDNVSIENTTMWHRENNQKWYSKFSISPQLGVGYGMFTKKTDVYIGVGVGYKFK